MDNDAECAKNGILRSSMSVIDALTPNTIEETNLNDIDTNSVLQIE